MKLWKSRSLHVTSDSAEILHEGSHQNITLMEKQSQRRLRSCSESILRPNISVTSLHDRKIYFILIRKNNLALYIVRRYTGEIALG